MADCSLPDCRAVGLVLHERALCIDWRVSGAVEYSLTIAINILWDPGVFSISQVYNEKRVLVTCQDKLFMCAIPLSPTLLHTPTILLERNIIKWTFPSASQSIPAPQ